MRWRYIVLSLLAVSAAFAARPWTEAEIRAADARGPTGVPMVDGPVRGPRRYNYLERIHLTCEFLRQYQVSDSLSPDFGGIIESEHQPGIIESDNTHEAVWVWSRWYELTGLDTYRENVRRAWVYLYRHPAWREHGGQPSSLWYAVWNAGLGFFAEAEYRRAFGDSTHAVYADTCRTFFLNNPLALYASALDYFVTGQSSGMAYDYAVLHDDNVLRDSALARGLRVKQWVEADAQVRLAVGNWAMCGGTAFWGIAHTFCKADTAAGRQWLQTYTDSLPGFYPSGTWNCSHNIWLANAYRSSAELVDAERPWLMHQYLVDTLLAKDTDRDGGIPATWTDPNTQDQTWVSTYLDFMGTDVFVTPTWTDDVSVLDFCSPPPGGFVVQGDSLAFAVPVANVGLRERTFTLTWRLPGYEDSRVVTDFPFLGIDTFDLVRWFASTPGILHAEAFCTPDSDPANDTARVDIKVYGRYTLAGQLVDSVTGLGFPVWVKARVTGSSTVWDSAYTDRSGNFTLEVLDTLMTLAIEPDPPYYDRSWSFSFHGDTALALVTSTAHLMLVNNDSLGRYDSYYTTALDSLDLTWSLWHRRAQGLPPYTCLADLRFPTVIWFTGDTGSLCVPTEDRAPFGQAASQGVNLLLTGQDIAQQMAGTQFLADLFGCRFDSSGWGGYFAFGNRSDSLGAPIAGLATAGGNGAGNQASRDAISPVNGGLGFIVYDSVAPVYAATRKTLGSGARNVLLGFGFEAVNRPPARPTYWGRTQLLGHILGWFGLPVGIEEPSTPQTSRPAPTATIVRSVLSLPSAFCNLTSDFVLLDAAGRRVSRLRPGPNDLSRLPAGVYFVTGQGIGTARVVKVR
jgi:hypothetical protein